MSGGARNASMVHLTRTLALQLGRDGITVNCIHPGATRTERTAVTLEARAKQAGMTPAEVEALDYAEDNPRSNSIGRIVDAAEIGYLSVFLCSDKAWAINGEVIAADGGGSRSVTTKYYCLHSRNTGAAGKWVDRNGLMSMPPRRRKRPYTVSRSQPHRALMSTNICSTTVS